MILSRNLERSVLFFGDRPAGSMWNLELPTPGRMVIVLEIGLITPPLGLNLFGISP